MWLYEYYLAGKLWIYLVAQLYRRPTRGSSGEIWQSNGHVKHEHCPHWIVFYDLHGLIRKIRLGR